LEPYLRASRDTSARAKIVETMVVGELLFLLAAEPVLGKPGVGVLEAAGVLVVVAQTGPLIVLWSIVTAAWARARPFKVAPVCKPILVPARILPTKIVLVPIVPPETNRHQTLQGSPPVTVELEEVVSVAADLKIQTPDVPLKVRLPVSKKASAQ